MVTKLRELAESQLIIKIGAVLFFGSFLATFVLTPTITVHDVSYEGAENDVSASAVYMSSLSDAQQEAVRSEKPVNSLGEYTDGGLNPKNQFGTVIGDDGVYYISATADYGVWQPFILYGNFLGAFAIAVSIIQTFWLNAWRDSSAVDEEVEE